jgi:lipoprotein-anchoring transpeptidase ErfK/SrfK
MQRLGPPPAVSNARPQPRPRRQIPSYVIVTAVAGGLMAAFFLTLIVAALLLVGGIYTSSNILPNVTVHGTAIRDVEVGGLSAQDATARLQNVTVDRKITLHDGSRTWEVSSGDLGISVDSAATASKAALAGREDGSLFTGLSAMVSGTQVTPVYTIDLAKAQSTLNALTSKINVQPDAINVKAQGRNLNIGATLDALPPDLNTLIDSGSMNLVMDIVEGPRTQYTVQRGEELGLIAKKFNVSVSDIMALNNITNANLIYPGQVLIIPAAGVWVPTEKDAPPAPLATGKSIVVNLKTQRIFAYQDGHLVHSSLMSSGNPGTETVQGDYKIYVKYTSTRMTGPGYDIPDVPWTMYFYKGYGIHGAYWHNNFGRTMSHGCVNLDTNEAKWFFDFAPVGTLVRVIPA